MTLKEYVSRWANGAGYDGTRALARALHCTEAALRAAYDRGYCSRRMAHDLAILSRGRLKRTTLIVGFDPEE